jgi:hypothetical protein
LMRLWSNTLSTLSHCWWNPPWHWHLGRQLGVFLMMSYVCIPYKSSNLLLGVPPGETLKEEFIVFVTYWSITDGPKLSCLSRYLGSLRRWQTGCWPEPSLPSFGSLCLT